MTDLTPQEEASIRAEAEALAEGYIKGAREERGRIVAWLRECYSLHRKENITLPDWYDAADALERGEHEEQT